MIIKIKHLFFLNQLRIINGNANAWIKKGARLIVGWIKQVPNIQPIKGIIVIFSKKEMCTIIQPKPSSQ
jgi:hypothetical protein